MQFTTRDSHHSAYSNVLEHTSHTAYIKDSLSVSSSSVMRYWVAAHWTIYTRERWTHSKCFGEILQHIFYSESMTSVLYSFWKADDHQICYGAWEQSSWATMVQWWLSYKLTSPAMMLTAHTLTFLGIHISHRPLGLHQSYIHCTQRLPIMSCSAAGGRYVGPLMARSNTLCHIKTDAALTSLPGPPALMMLTLYEGRSMFIEVTQASRPSLNGF